MKLIGKNFGIGALAFLASAFLVDGIYAQAAVQSRFKKLLHPPKEYTVLRTAGELTIDGKDNEKDWKRAAWSDFFVDIEGMDKSEADKKTRCKMLWDKEYLYLFVQLEETDIWATLREQDAAVFQDNAFEIFIDPDGDTHNYFEIQVNALGTVWDLFMTKPYRNGGKSLSSWDVKGLQKAIVLNGSLNVPDDTDKGWSVELAIPFGALKLSGTSNPEIGDIWRLNLSRVAWELEVVEGGYQRKENQQTGLVLPADYSTWSPQGIVNLHYPERYGYILFSEEESSASFLSEEVEASKLLLWKYYYLQKDFKQETGKYATDFQELKIHYPDLTDIHEETKISISGSEQQFWMQIGPHSVNEHGEITYTSRPSENKL